jgi:hypothetical protein
MAEPLRKVGLGHLDRQSIDLDLFFIVLHHRFALQWLNSPSNQSVPLPQITNASFLNVLCLLQPGSEVQLVPHGLGKAPGMLTHPDDGPELSVCLQAVTMRSCWSASLMYQSLGVR